ncbi:uncharacterized protein G2W53_014773 [Senna tora]|uniref:Uncharacterized protein n=1 Tax=Senna tora TaxID=362788 RepID=A0A835C6B5_9FABA|nr:uncharacterized protein G2W53_014773 [Senna tora]
MRFLRQDLLQREDGTKRSDATRRRCREICPVAMDPPSMVATSVFELSAFQGFLDQVDKSSGVSGISSSNDNYKESEIRLISADSAELQNHSAELVILQNHS